MGYPDIEHDYGQSDRGRGPGGRASIAGRRLEGGRARHDRETHAAADLRPFQILPVTNEVKQRHAGRQIGGNILIVKYELQHPLITYNFSLLTYCDGDLQK